MSRSQFFTYFLLGSLLTACGRADRIVTHIIKDNDLRHNCAFELNGHGYNLCPLAEERVVVEGSGVAKSYDEDKGEGSSSEGRFYEVTLGGLDAYSFSTRVTSGLEGSGCGEDTWMRGDVEDTDRWDIIAGNIKSTRKTPRASSIARKARRSRKSSALKTTISLNIQKENNDADHLPLHLSLYGGMLEKQRQSAEIVFICSDEETLKYVREDKGVHFFSWTTSHGCPTKLTSTTHPDIVAANEPNSGSEEPAPGDKQGDDDLMPLDNSRARRWIAIIVVVLVSGLVFGCILLSSSRARSLATENLKGATYTILPLLSQAFTKLRPIGNSIHRTTKSIVRVGSRFRQGDSKLVRWAQEDMSLLDSEDVMVNGSGAMGREDDWNVNGMEEYIPLTNNPQHGRRVVRSYGATPDVETFAERGAMSGLAKYFHR
ncbi:hypothetical protein CVT25_012461 [Psilocybe cyanescens]|uniref:Autophagy-related protein 27 n=1 Tax=Psilocybe cyanescens TaxID=93625 RepID=A0A409XHD5_PSICY|nr:hypothetical protein CVT25_012461 [Psilocybe cyanescens]